MLSDKLFSLRRRTGMSQQDVASAIGVTRQTVSNWEQGQSAPTLDKAAALAHLYGVSLDDLASDDVDVVSSGEPKHAPDLHVIGAFVGTKDVTIELSCDERYSYIQNADILEMDKDWLRVSVARKTAAFGKSKVQEERTICLIDLEDILGISAAISETQQSEKR